MAHQIEINKVTGKAGFAYFGEQGWHGLGQQITDPYNIDQVIVDAGLDWMVRLEPQQTLSGIPCKTRGVIRDSDNRLLSEVGPRWTPLQNHEAFKWFQPFLESKECHIETAGCLFEGEKIFVMAKLAREDMEIVPGDTIRKYIMLSNEHSDKRSARVTLTPQRVVCWNTMCAAFGNKSTKYLGVKHTAKIKSNLEAIRDTINTINMEFEATAEQFRTLASKQINLKDLKKYIKLVFKTKETEEVDEKESKEDDSRLIENKILPLFEHGKGMDIPGVAGTYWAAYNSITEFLSHHASRTDDARLDNLWWGIAANTNKRALDTALDMIKAA